MRSLVAGSVLLLLVSTPTSSFPAPRDVLAEIDGSVITDKEITDALGVQLRKLETQIYRLKRAQLEATINDRVLGREAARRGLTVQSLLAEEVTAKTAAVTDEEVDAYYAANKARFKGHERQVKAQIRADLQNQRLGERRKTFVESLRSQFQIAVHLEEPPPFRVVIANDGAPSIGSADAPVTVVTFSDFHCPYCKRVLPTLAELRSRYGDKIRIVFRDFPLDAMHPHARRAAEAARCAGDQDKFWEYHDALFANAPRAGNDQLKQYAETVGLDAPRFDHCLSSRMHAPAVQKDFDEGIRLGVTGTPAFFINGQPLSGAQPLEAFVRLIEEELKTAR